MPTVYDFTDYRSYLRAWLAAPGRRLSQNALSKKVGLSKGMTSQTLAGTRDLAPHRARDFSDALGHDPEERKYFEDLVIAEHGATLQERRSARARLLAARAFRTSRRITDPQARLFSRWYYPAVAELVRCRGFQDDPAWIARTLVPNITEIEAEEAVAVLLELGVLVRTDQGLRSSEANYTTGWEVDHDAVSEALREHHRTMLRHAGEALSQFSAEQRQFDTLTVPVAAEALPEVKRRMAEFQMELVQLCERNPGDLLVHLGFQLFPVSRPPDVTGS
jgi:uncharacterized protein (TIGR02147 family)